MVMSVETAAVFVRAVQSVALMLCAMKEAIPEQQGGIPCLNCDDALQTVICRVTESSICIPRPLDELNDNNEQTLFRRFF